MLFIVAKKRKLMQISVVFVIAFAAYFIWGVVSASQAVNLRNSGKNDPKYLILINIDEKILYLFDEGECIREFPIASGMPDWPSPLGQWKIVEKSDWGEGFGGYWMGLNVKWGNYGIHGTDKEYSIGGDESHGCIRMFNRDAKELYGIVPIGTPVVIKKGDFGPFGTGFRKLRPGDRGADVLAVQQRLKELGYFSGEETGIYEDDLKDAIYRFQRDNKLRVKYTLTEPDYTAMGFREFE